MKEHYSAKLTAWLLAAVMLLSSVPAFSGCGKDNGTVEVPVPAVPDTAVTDTAEAAEKTEAVTEPTEAQAADAVRVDVVKSYSGIDTEDFERVEFIGVGADGNTVWTYADQVDFRGQVDIFNTYVADGAFALCYSGATGTLTALEFHSGQVAWTLENFCGGYVWADHDDVIYTDVNHGLDGAGYAVRGCTAIDAAGKIMWTYMHPVYDADESGYDLGSISPDENGIKLNYEPAFDSEKTDYPVVMLDFAGNEIG